MVRLLKILGLGRFDADPFTSRKPRKRIFLGSLALTCCLLASAQSRADTLYVSQASNNMIVTYDTTASPPTPTTFASTGLD